MRFYPVPSPEIANTRPKIAKRRGRPPLPTGKTIGVRLMFRPNAIEVETIKGLAFEWGKLAGRTLGVSEVLRVAIEVAHAATVGRRPKIPWWKKGKAADRAETPVSTQRADHQETTEQTQRATRVETSVHTQRAEKRQSPVGPQRAKDHELPDAAKRARAARNQPLEIRERVETAHSPVPSQRADERQPPVRYERAVKTEPPETAERVAPIKRKSTATSLPTLSTDEAIALKSLYELLCDLDGTLFDEVENFNKIPDEDLRGRQMALNRARSAEKKFAKALQDAKELQTRLIASHGPKSPFASDTLDMKLPGSVEPNGKLPRHINRTCELLENWIERYKLS